MTPQPRIRPVVKISLTLLALALFPCLALAQPPGSGWQWESPIGAAPGEETVIHPVSGGGDHASFQVQVPGFWYRDRVGMDSNQYVELNFPGLGHLQQPGAPKLPAVQVNLAIPSDAPRVEVVEFEYSQVYQYEMQVYPTTIPERDHPEGDPEMKIRRHSPPSWTVVAPEQVPTCEPPGCSLDIEIYDGQGTPMEYVIVSAWKPGDPLDKDGEKDVDDVFVNRYTNGGGQASLPVAPSSAGTLRLVARDLDGNSFVTTIPVVDGPTAVPGVGPGALRISAEPSITDATTTFRFSRAPRRPVQVEVFDIRGRRVRVLEAGVEMSAVGWDGRDGAGRSLPSGIYYARVAEAGTTSTTRVMVVK